MIVNFFCALNLLYAIRLPSSNRNRVYFLSACCSYCLYFFLFFLHNCFDSFKRRFYDAIMCSQRVSSQECTMQYKFWWTLLILESFIDQCALDYIYMYKIYIQLQIFFNGILDSHQYLMIVNKAIHVIGCHQFLMW